MRSLSRRRFITLAGGAGAAAGAAAMFPRAAWATPMGLPIGIQLYMVSTPMKEDTPATLKKLYEIGFREVEPAGTGKYSASEFKGLIADAGLTCPSVHLQVKKDDFEAALADAKALGAHYAVTSVLKFPKASPPPKAPESKAGLEKLGLASYGLDGFKEMAAKMNEVGAKARASGLQYAYHNHNLEFEKLPDGTLGFDLLVKETDPELVKFEIDCGWMVAAGSNPVDYFKRYPGRFKMLHIKDFQAQGIPTIDIWGVGRPKGTDLGTGVVDYKPIFAAGKAAGIEHIFAEQEAPFAVSQMASATADYAYMAKFS
jgi:sugar phosphate isomerase/epimerase